MESQTKISVKGGNVSIKFGSSKEDQEEAHSFMSMLRDAEMSKKDDDEGRILLFGFSWHRGEKGSSTYHAYDGRRIFTVKREGNRAWRATFQHPDGTIEDLGVHTKGGNARGACESRGRQLPEDRR